MNSIDSSFIEGSALKDNFECQFALCKKCSWNATVFKPKAKKSVIALGICPACSNENICLIPISYIRLYNFNTYSYPQGKKQEYC